MRGVIPAAPSDRIEPHRARPAPLPVPRRADEQAVLHDLANLGRDGADAVEIEDDAAFLRPGLPRDIVRKLRRTHWAIQDRLDLHGMTGDEAALATAAFLAASRAQGLRCVLIVHGKGLRSPGREPVLKGRIRQLLTRRPEVLAFAEPRAAEGGGGAVVVLIEA
jgi:DNA-nicking Smr family endonuclease